MKTKLLLLVIVLLAVVFFLSCTMESGRDYLYLKIIKGHDLFYDDNFVNLNSYEEISDYINNNVVYDDADDQGSIKNPKMVIDTGLGACADIAVLFQNIAYYGMSIEMDYVLILYIPTSSRAIGTGVSANHAVLMYDGKMIEPGNGEEILFDVCFYYTFDEVFKQ